MATSKRALIKQSKSFFRRRSIKLNITVVDLSSVMAMPGKVSRESIDGKYHYYRIEPRESGIGKLMEDVL